MPNIFLNTAQSSRIRAPIPSVSLRVKLRRLSTWKILAGFLAITSGAVVVRRRRSELPASLLENSIEVSKLAIQNQACIRYDHCAADTLRTQDLSQLHDRSWIRPGHHGVCSPHTTHRVFEISRLSQQWLELKPCDLFSLLHGRRLWLVGDSQQDSLLMALRHFLRRYSESQGISFTQVPVEKLGDVHTVDTSKSRCVSLAYSTQICHIRMPRLEHQGFQNLTDVLAAHHGDFSKDFVVLNSGLHYYANRNQLAEDLMQLAIFRNNRVNKSGQSALPLTIWMDTPPQHFGTPDGGYNHTIRTLNTTECSPFTPAILASNYRGPFNSISDLHAQHISDIQMSVWDVSRLAHFAHARPGDCTHFCRPGVPELWVLMLTKTILAGLGSGCNIV
jgi:hypothetical protein